MSHRSGRSSCTNSFAGEGDPLNARRQSPRRRRWRSCRALRPACRSRCRPGRYRGPAVASPAAAIPPSSRDNPGRGGSQAGRQRCRRVSAGVSGASGRSGVFPFRQGLLPQRGGAEHARPVPSTRRPCWARASAHPFLEPLVEDVHRPQVESGRVLARSDSEALANRWAISTSA